MAEEHLQQQITGFLNTPPIWVNTQFGMQQFEFPQVNLTSFSPTPIPQKLRLGHQMEYVCKQLLDHFPKYKVLLHNLPIRQGKQTIGEIDFILKDLESKTLIHVELTYKFYIINPEVLEPMHQLMGPNRRDMFFTKMEKIKNRQFELLHSPEGSAALEALEIDHTKIRHQACFKAQLFAPYGSKIRSLRPLNSNCVIGYWLRITELQADAFTSCEFYIPNKSQWVIKPHGNVIWMSHYEALIEINIRLLNQNAPMVWLKKSDTKFEKFFVVWW